jgi:hypothetical protein
VLADARGESSAAFVKLLLRSFLLGTPGVPVAGMQALSDHLASRIGKRLTTGVAVDSVQTHDTHATVVTGDRTWRARAAVVAVGGEAVHGLTPLPPVRTRALTTWWFAASEAPARLPLLAIDARAPGGGPAGPVVNAADLTAAAPSYAPAGRRLVQATTLAPEDEAGDREVRRHLGEIYGVPTESWELVVRHHIPHALPAQPPPLAARRSVMLAPRLFVAGDHRDTASIQGALVSGTRAAAAVRAAVH